MSLAIQGNDSSSFLNLGIEGHNMFPNHCLGQLGLSGEQYWAEKIKEIDFDPTSETGLVSQRVVKYLFSD